VRDSSWTRPLNIGESSGSSAWGENEKQTPRGEHPVATPPAAHQDWIFDRGLYTNDPKTGKRTWQYRRKSRAYRDPNAWFDSPHESFPFAPDPYFDGYPYHGFYPYYAPYWYGGAWPYAGFLPPFYGPHPYVE
jgi:hypothetical protein